MSNWKTTVAGILSGLIGTLTALMTFQVPSALLSPAQAHTWLWITVACNLGCIIGRVWLGIIQSDAPNLKVVPVILFAAMLGGMLGLSGCAKFDRATFNTLSVSNAVLETAQQDYETGKLPHNVCVYNLINKGKTAQGLAETAFLDEWQTEQAKGDVTALQGQIAADIASIAPIVASIQGLYKNPTCGSQS